MFKIVLVLCAILIPLSQASANPPSMGGYCVKPPFLAARTQPNVMVIFDNSGSMTGQAYGGTFDPTQFSTGHYYGYFDPTKNYKYTTGTPSRWIPTADDITTGTVANPIASGDLLNWATMKRVDVSKRIIIGGKASSGAYNAADRTTNPVKLYGHDNGSFNKDHTGTAAQISPPFAGTSYEYAVNGTTLTLTSNVASPRKIYCQTAMSVSLLYGRRFRPYPHTLK